MTAIALAAGAVELQQACVRVSVDRPAKRAAREAIDELARAGQRITAAGDDAAVRAGGFARDLFGQISELERDRAAHRRRLVGNERLDRAGPGAQPRQLGQPEQAGHRARQVPILKPGNARRRRLALVGRRSAVADRRPRSRTHARAALAAGAAGRRARCVAFLLRHDRARPWVDLTAACSARGHQRAQRRDSFHREPPTQKPCHCDRLAKRRSPRALANFTSDFRRQQLAAHEGAAVGGAARSRASWRSSRNVPNGTMLISRAQAARSKENLPRASSNATSTT